MQNGSRELRSHILQCFNRRPHVAIVFGVFVRARVCERENNNEKKKQEKFSVRV